MNDETVECPWCREKIVANYYQRQGVEPVWCKICGYEGCVTKKKEEKGP